MDMTLREIYSAFGISRRTIQGYEKAGLISVSGKNERGHLLYNENAQERIKKIRLFQQMGFTIKEIKDIIDAPKDVQKPALEKQREKLKEETKDTELIIYKMSELIETLQH
ncbi:MAG: MerR family transcriptional regulator [Lachnospiraceae bacterium]|nr:MerR family transcriptional regulator [Lachnospiraceae bacterium]